MEFAIVLLTVVPVRAEPSDRSEIVTQLLFGETASIIEKHDKPNWVKIKSGVDGYEGWVDPKQLVLISEETYLSCKDQFSYTSQGEALVQNELRKLMFGSRMPLSNSLPFSFEFNGELLNYQPEDILLVAQQYIGTPYLWGGRSDVGIDCSGYSQQVFGICGIKLPRDAYQQAKEGKSVNYENRNIGDLMFFKNDKNRVIHVGILIDAEYILHAHGRVKQNNYDRKGILTDDEKSYSHHFDCIRRYT